MTELISKFIETDQGKGHYQIPSTLNKENPMVLFLHGGSKKGQNTDFWKPISDIMMNYTNPIVLDRFGHGQSVGNEGLKANDELIKAIINQVLSKAGDEQLFIVGRSAGTVFAIRQYNINQEKIKGLGLIAPGSMKTYGKKLEEFNKKLTILWDIDDPIVNFSNYEIIKKLNIDHTLFTVGEHSNSKKSVPRDSVSKSHAPEINAPDLFEEFLLDLIR